MKLGWTSVFGLEGRMYSKSDIQLQEPPDGMNAAQSVPSFSMMNAPGTRGEQLANHPSWNEGDYSGDLRDFRDSKECDSGQGTNQPRRRTQPGSARTER